jgi:6-pyruvoyl tetrahydropterin synthase/QueD family protein
MYELTIKAHFDAAHALRGYPGECKNLHGHTWDVEVTVLGSDLDDIGIVYDFKRLKVGEQVKVKEIVVWESPIAKIVYRR